MPGANYAVVGCGTSRRIRGIRIFKLPKAINEKNTEQRQNWFDILKKTRFVDADFKRQIEEYVSSLQISG